MERLTIHTQVGTELFACKDCYKPACLGCDYIKKAFSHLAAYEDTGLEPGEIKDLQVCHRNQYESLAFLLCETDCEISHVKELLSAEKEGRLVVLPCKVGDHVWINGLLGCGEAEEHIVTSAIRSEDVDGVTLRFQANLVGAEEDNWCFFFGTHVGKYVFLTREEAEAALKG